MVSARSEMRAFVALGSNLGDRAGLLEVAVADLDARRDTRVHRVSSWYETRPIAPATLPFLNGVVELYSELAPAQLMAVLLEIEADHGRLRTRDGADRTLDLDLVCAFRDRASIVLPPCPGDASALTLPHPRACERDFVLVPLAELDPSLFVDGVTCSDRVAGLPERLRTILSRRLRSPTVSC